eukprot:TRINITY_DN1074_c0_g3_i1.p1 TRINITY_DN1074_c0_g3~~TRINITY_DN1074_c0_g3_i1.p1  ORF type:complete len:470 (+),score=83.93 TRINITY_DN1074_c0_g3_i1:19-1428(+)
MIWTLILAAVALALLFKLSKRDPIVPEGLKLPVKVLSPSNLPLPVEYGKHPSKTLLWAKKTFGPIVDLDLMVSRFIFVFDPELSNKIYSWPSSEISFDGGVLEAVKHIFGADIFDANPEWTKKSPGSIRQGIMTLRSIQNFKPIIESEVDKVISEWSSLSEVELNHEASNLVLRTAVRLIMGEYLYEHHCDTLIDKFRRLEMEGFSSLTFLFPWLPFGSPKQAKLMKKGLDEICGDYVRNHAEKYTAEHPEAVDYMTGFFRNGYYALAGERLTINHMIALLFAFHANTAGTFAWTVMHLVNNSSAREKVLREHAEQTQKGTDLTDVSNFPFLRACIRETVRKYGSLLNIRKAMKDVQVGDYFIPAGRLVCVSSWVMGNDPDLVHEPEQWNPERFFDSKQEFAPYYHPFGTGLHPCMGEKIAMMIFIHAINKIFTEYKFEPKSKEMPQVDWQRASFFFAKDPYFVTISKQ